jgi:hypothetical protein
MHNADEPVIHNTPTEQVVIRYSMSQPNGDDRFDDALYFTVEEYKHQTEATIKAEQVRRYENWRAVIHAVRPEPPAEEIAQQVEGLKAQQLQAQEQILRNVSEDDALAILRRQQEIIAEQMAQIEQRKGMV